MLAIVAQHFVAINRNAITLAPVGPAPEAGNDRRPVPGCQAPRARDPGDDGVK